MAENRNWQQGDKNVKGKKIKVQDSSQNNLKMKWMLFYIEAHHMARYYNL